MFYAKMYKVKACMHVSVSVQRQMFKVCMNTLQKCTYDIYTIIKKKNLSSECST